MTQKEEEVTWAIEQLTAAQDSGKAMTVEKFLVSKLGGSAGKRLFKELLAVSKELTKSVAGNPVINLNAKGGEFVAAREI